MLPGPTLNAGHWSVALGLALLLHAALALLLFQPAAPGALAGGRGGIQVGLGPAGGAAGAPSDVEPEEAPGVEAPLPEAQEALPPPAETLPPEAVQEAAPVPPAEADTVQAVEAPPPADMPLYAPIEEVKAETPPAEAQVAAEEVPAEEVPLEETTAQVAMQTPPKPLAKPEPPEISQPQPQPTREPVSQPAPRPVPESLQAAVRESGQTAAAPAKGTPGAMVNGTRGKAGIGDTATAGAAASSGAGGNPGAYVDYKQLIMAWLQQHKEYPRRAKLRRQEGRARLFIAVDGRGRLLDYRVDHSSGYKLLDEEVTAMVERAQPLPAAQAGGDTARYEFRFTVEFGLR